MSRVAKQQCFAVHMPGRTANGDHRAGGIAEIVLLEMWHQRDGVRELRLEKVRTFSARIEACKAGAAFERQEQNAGKGAIDVGQGDEHKGAARPDVQRVRLETMRTAGRGRDGEFLIAVIEILSCEKLKRGQFQHLSANGRGSPVRADRNFGIDGSLASGLFVAEPHGASLQIQSRCNVR